MKTPGTARPGTLAEHAKEQAELVARLTEAAEDYRSMGTRGHAGLGGWCISVGNRYAGLVDAFLGCPEEPQGQEKKQRTPEAAGGQGVDRYAALGELGFPLLKWGEKTASQWERYYKFDCIGDYWRWAYRVQGSGCQAQKPRRERPWGIWETIRDKYPNEAHQENARKERIAQHRKGHGSARPVVEGVEESGNDSGGPGG